MHTPDDAPRLSTGDRVVHAARPEWGQGQVTAVSPFQRGGVKAQRVTVRFERAGLKTLSTDFAELKPVGSDAPRPPRPARPARSARSSSPNPPHPLGRPDADASPPSSGAGLASNHLDEDPAGVMSRLPDSATDPFRPADARLASLLSLYGPSPDGRSLLDWAAVQSGLADPLSRFTRHELEEFFRRFEMNRDRELTTLLPRARKENPQGAAAAIAAAPPQAKREVSRRDGRR